MALYEYPLFKMSRKFLLLVGQWPYDFGRKKYLIRVVICLVPIITFVTEIHEFITGKSEIEQLMRVLSLFSFLALAFIKYFNCWVKIGVIRDILEFITLDCDALRCENEIEIMKRSAAEGWALGKTYTIFMLVALIGIILMLFAPSILDMIKPLEESRTEKLLSQAGYLPDHHRHNFYVVLKVQSIVVVGIIVSLAGDLMYIAIVYYFAGMYCVAGYRLEHMFDDVQLMSDSQKKAVIRQRILNVVALQSKIVKGTNLVMSCYPKFFAAQFFVVVLAIAAALGTLHDHLVSRNLAVIVALVFAITGYYFGVFVNITPGQNIVDRSSELFHKLYSSNWYQAPLKSQKLMLFMMQKVRKPFILSTERILDITYETCSTIVRASFSYYMMMSSFKK